MTHLWQSTIFAAVVALVTLLLRKHRARTRYWLWLAASLKFLVPFSLFTAIGSHIQWRTVQAVAPPEWTPAMQLTPQAIPAMTQSAATVSVWQVGLLLVWVCGLAAVLGYYGLRWRRIRAVMRQASSINSIAGLKVMASPTLLEPAIFGVWRPVLLIPQGLIESLRSEQWEAALEHEKCHVRYHDNLTATLHMIVQAMFWFHPLVWWLGARLVAERERACDEAVLQSGSDPEVYAEAILQVCRLYLGSPLPCAAGVSGANLKHRVERIMLASTGRKLGWRARMLLAAAGALTIATPLMWGIVNAPPAHVQAATEETPIHAIAWKSVKLSASPKRAPGFDRGPGAAFGLSAGEINIKYATLRWLVGRAYLLRSFQVTGGPAWAASSLYEITAKAETSSLRQINIATGPMLQRLLQNRFALRSHYETRQLPVYAVVVTSKEPKLKPTIVGSCVAVRWPPSKMPSQDKPICGLDRQGLTTQLNHTDDFVGMGIAGEPDNPASLVNFLSWQVGEPVLDKTGLKGLYNIHLEWNLAATEAQVRNGRPSSMERDNPSLFAAVQNQLGLKLEPTQGPVRVLVIDHAEKPAL